MSSNEDGKTQAAEKSNFSRRCSLLSRYIKQNGSFGNIDLGLVRKPATDLVLPGQSDPQENQNAMPKAESSEVKAIDFFQRISKGEPSTSSGGKFKEANLSVAASRSSQLTIFFRDKVLVYDEFPEDKAKQIMEIAKQAKSVSEINIQTKTDVENNNNIVLPDLNEPTSTVDINQQNQVVERIARRASLHRFFAKRKDRAVARAPYQVHVNADHRPYPSKPEMAAGQRLETGQSSQIPDNAVPQTVAHPKTDSDEDVVMEVEEEGQSSKDLELRL